MAVGSFVPRSRTILEASPYVTAVGLPYDEPAAFPCRPGLTGSVAVLLGNALSVGEGESAVKVCNPLQRVMDKDKSPAPGGGGGGGSGGGLPLHLSRYSPFGSPSSSFSFMGDLSASSSSQPSSDSGHFAHETPSDAGRFSYDVSRMPDFPPSNSGHRRAHSEILGLPDDISFDSDLGVVGSHDGPSLSDETEEDLVSMYIDVEKFSSGATSAALSIGEASQSALPPVQAPLQGENVALGSSEKPRIRHQHSQSLDGSTAIKSELLVSGGEGPSSAEAKKAMAAAKLAELALVDPKRTKRYSLPNKVLYFPLSYLAELFVKLIVSLEVFNDTETKCMLYRTFTDALEVHHLISRHSRSLFEYY
ncbi:hypothetical protein B296_00007092 [Ensete ventricosum]|uniref:Uncharacterized protein n=1 Tax=Ensete ventricosum TaxID=4639 RepID=A0A426YXZ3_ENSVE|nr:hypothetical protein B296_00007092 [Ensete ventricosum]